MPLLPKHFLITLGILCTTAGAGLLVAWILMHGSNLFAPAALPLPIAAVVLDLVGIACIVYAAKSGPRA